MLQPVLDPFDWCWISSHCYFPEDNYPFEPLQTSASSSHSLSPHSPTGFLISTHQTSPYSFICSILSYLSPITPSHSSKWTFYSKLSHYSPILLSWNTPLLRRFDRLSLKNAPFSIISHGPSPIMLISYPPFPLLLVWPCSSMIGSRRLLVRRLEISMGLELIILNRNPLIRQFIGVSLYFETPLVPFSKVTLFVWLLALVIFIFIFFIELLMEAKLVFVWMHRWFSIDRTNFCLNWIV